MLFSLRPTLLSRCIVRISEMSASTSRLSTRHQYRWYWYWYRNCNWNWYRGQTKIKGIPTVSVNMQSRVENSSNSNSNKKNIYHNDRHKQGPDVQIDKQFVVVTTGILKQEYGSRHHRLMQMIATAISVVMVMKVYVQFTGCRSVRVLEKCMGFWLMPQHPCHTRNSFCSSSQDGGLVFGITYTLLLQFTLLSAA